MTDQKAWISAAMRTARAGRNILDLKTNLDICGAVIAEAMRREEYQVAAGYQKLADTLRAEFK